MVSSHSRPLLGGDEEPEWIFYESDRSIDNNLGDYGIRNFEIWSKTDGGIKITNDDNTDNNISTSSKSSSSSKKHMDNSTTTRRHRKTKKMETKIKKETNAPTKNNIRG